MEKPGKKSIKLYETEIMTLLSLPDEQRNHIITALLSNSVGGERPELDAMETAVYTLINAQVERADELSKKRAQSVSTRWDGSKKAENEDTDSYKAVQNDTNAYTNTSTITSTNTNTNTDTSTNTNTGGMGEQPTEPAGNVQGQTEPQQEKQREKMTSQQQERFNAFWQEYPKKQGKGAAETAWKKLKPSAELTEKMLESLEQAKNCAQWQREGGQYIPNPSTWLNQKRWEDDYSYLPPSRKPLTASDYGDDEDIPQW